MSASNDHIVAVAAIGGGAVVLAALVTVWGAWLLQTRGPRLGQAGYKVIDVRTVPARTEERAGYLPWMPVRIVATPLRHEKLIEYTDGTRRWTPCASHEFASLQDIQRAVAEDRPVQEKAPSDFDG